MDVTVKVDESHIGNALCAGFEGGVGYWAEITGYDYPAHAVAFLEEHAGMTTPQVIKYADYPLSIDGAVLLRDMEGGSNRTNYRLDRVAIQRGLQVLANKYPNTLASIMSDDADSNDGDVLIQCAIFGKVMYM